MWLALFLLLLVSKIVHLFAVHNNCAYIEIYRIFVFDYTGKLETEPLDTFPAKRIGEILIIV